MATRKNISKVVKYIQDDRVHKLKSYVRKHRKMDLSSVLLDQSRTLLHLACLDGHDACLRFLLKRGVDPMLCDADGNLGLHLAAVYASKPGNLYAYTDLVLPLIKACPESLDVVNNRGVSPRLLLDDVKTKLQHHITESPSESPESSEEKWTGKLFSEMQDDLEERYEQDFYHESSRSHESYEEWSRRIAREKRNKEQQQHSDGRKRKKKEKDEKEKEEQQRKFQRKLEMEHEEYLQRGQRKEEEIIKEKRQKYEDQCMEFFSGKSDKEIRYRDIPWPDKRNVSKGAEIVTSGQDKIDPVTFKKYLREQRVRWHPDKFMQKCGHRLKQEEKEKILEKIKEISQTLNKIIDATDVKTS